MATAVLNPTQVTVPVAETRWPTANGFTLPAGATIFKGTVDTTSMLTANSFWFEVEFLVSGAWQPGSGVLVTGGTHPQRGGGSSPTVQFEGVIPQSPYPTKARFHTYAAHAASTVTVSGDIE